MAQDEKETVFYKLTGKLKRETPKAILVVYDEKKNKEVWFPKSRVDYTEEGDDMVTCSVPEWLINRNNLEDYVEKDDDA